MSPVARPRLPRLHLHRLAEAPAVQLARIEAAAATVALRGVVCGICADRTRDALLSMPGVQAVEVDLDASRATLRLSAGARVEAGAMQQALERVVVGMPARRLMERLVHRWDRVRAGGWGRTA